MGAVQKATAVAAVSAMLGIGMSASAAASSATASANPSAQSAAVSQTLRAVNSQRKARGLRPLRWNSRLGTAAKRMASDMRRRHYLSHVTPNGKDLRDRLASTGYLRGKNKFAPAGEDIGWGEDELGTPEAMVLAWLKSPEHRRNLLEPRFTELGIGVVKGSPIAGESSGAIFVADFGGAK